jgi:hypothetical protein
LLEQLLSVFIIDQKPAIFADKHLLCKLIHELHLLLLAVVDKHALGYHVNGLQPDGVEKENV